MHSQECSGGKEKEETSCQNVMVIEQWPSKFDILRLPSEVQVEASPSS